MTDGTPMIDAWLRAQQMTETFSGFTAREIETMSMDEFARLAGRERVTRPTAPPPRQRARTRPA
jgi:hypothetical protein